MKQPPRIEHAVADIADVRLQLEELAARRPQPHTAEAEATILAVNLLLDRAEKAATGKEPPARSWLQRIWTGEQLEATYHPLHAAKVHLVGLYDTAEVAAAVPAAIERTRQYLDRGDQRRVEAEKLPMLAPEKRPAALREARATSYEASDLDHRQQRTFRNSLIGASVSTFLLVLVLGGVLFYKPQFAHICFDSVRQEGVLTAPRVTPSPAANGEPVTTTRQTVCPSGTAADRGPNGWDIVLVLFFGGVGAGLAAAVTVRNLKVSTSPYDVPLVLSVFKLPLGALTAFIGVMAIRGGLVPGLSALDSPAEILTYAVVLGYAQQLATGFLDRRASSLGRSDPS